MKSWILCLIVILLVLSTVSAGKKIFEGRAFPNEVFEADGFEFVVLESNKNDTVFLVYLRGDQNKTYILHWDETLTTDEFRIRYWGRRFDLDRGWGKLHNETFEEMYEYLFNIDSLLPELQVKKTVDYVHQDLYDPVKIKVEIKNIGEGVARNFTYTQKLPNYAVASSSEGDVGNMVLWKGDVHDEELIEYSLRSKKEQIVTLYPEIEYSFAGWKYYVDTTPLNITFSSKLSIEPRLNSSRIILGDYVEYSLFVENGADNPQDSSLEIDFPQGYEVFFTGINSSTERFFRDGKLQHVGGSSEYRWKGHVLADENLTFLFTLHPVRISRGEIEYKYDVTVDGVLNSRSSSIPIKTYYNSPYLEIGLNSTKISAGEPLNILLLLKQNQTSVRMKNLYVFLDGNFIESMETFEKNLLLDSEHFIVFNIIYEPRPVNDTAWISAFAYYQTPFGENITIFLNKSKAYSIINTEAFVESTTLEELFYEKKNIFQKTTAFFDSSIHGFFSHFSTNDVKTRDNVFLVPIVITALILGVSIMNKWGVFDRFKRFKR